ncbi:SUMF1/EgtB/PvdO family nonheme iron enzyme [Neolewinella litorea]|uniref:Sulfatase-modifying factor enzyme-like domain-containing protein n=1 Tax=Neolewinella litorea TaxID=2562452 RepID=A0A4S4NLA4_9BACT|nr:SUMF1/EgtB/PvdO family nonheme iron enzyme [Neolewinella litorea]THH40669.1 hypothetical protein E4021_08040 [Neolewinella litorea]
MVRLYLIFLASLGCTVLLGNNIQITDLRVDYETGNPGYGLLTFDLSWENSWRTSAAPANWDAAWVFAKYRVGPNGEWQHILLTAGAPAPTGAVVEVMDGTGAMVYAAADQATHAHYRQTQLRWNLAANGVDYIDELEFRVFGIEMVYVPEGAYWLGSTEKGKETNKFYAAGDKKKRPPYLVASADEIAVGTNDGELYYEDKDGDGADFAGPIPADFPKGFGAFYAMKYELSQKQYVDFFNTLTPAQKAVHDITDATGKGTDEDHSRNCISYDHRIGGDATTSAPHVPVGFVSIADMMAYFDWSGLRPMSEMEFEKLCRGPELPVKEEYAWGTAKIAKWKFEPANVNGSGEILINLNKLKPTDGYAAYEKTTKATRSGFGPLRSGIFSASLGLGSTRVWSGAGYYGNMELSGNQWEGVVSVTHADGRSFTNRHGNGFLPESGYADVPTWPQTEHGIGARGGRSNSDEDYLRVADRSYMTLTEYDQHSRNFYMQFRGVRGL